MTSPDLPVEIWAHIASYGADILGRLLLTIKDLNRYLHDHCMLDDDSPMFQGYLREVYVNYDEARTVIVGSPDRPWPRHTPIKGYTVYRRGKKYYVDRSRGPHGIANDLESLSDPKSIGFTNPRAPKDSESLKDPKTHVLIGRNVYPIGKRIGTDGRLDIIAGKNGSDAKAVYVNYKKVRCEISSTDEIIYNAYTKEVTYRKEWPKTYFMTVGKSIRIGIASFFWSIVFGKTVKVEMLGVEYTFERCKIAPGYLRLRGNGVCTYRERNGIINIFHRNDKGFTRIRQEGDITMISFAASGIVYHAIHKRDEQIDAFEADNGIRHCKRGLFYTEFSSRERYRLIRDEDYLLERSEDAERLCINGRIRGIHRPSGFGFIDGRRITPLDAPVPRVNPDLESWP